MIGSYIADELALALIGWFIFRRRLPLHTLKREVDAANAKRFGPSFSWLSITSIPSYLGHISQSGFYYLPHILISRNSSAVMDPKPISYLLLHLESGEIRRRVEKASAMK